MKNPNSYSKIKDEFDNKYKYENEFECFLPVHLEYSKRTVIKNSKGELNEEFYKWQFLYGIVYSGMYTKNHIGTEIHFPKGNKSAAPIKIDAAIFDDENWFTYYEKYGVGRN